MHGCGIALWEPCSHDPRSEGHFVKHLINEVFVINPVLLKNASAICKRGLPVPFSNTEKDRAFIDPFCPKPFHVAQGKPAFSEHQGPAANILNSKEPVI
jgi:hypothetical protein